MPASAELVVARGLGKTYRGAKGATTVATTDICFAARAGEVFGLLGPNGAGKTTTLRMLSTVLTPTTGTASIDGHDVVSHPDRVRAAIGFLSGNTGLYPRLTPREVLAYFGRLYGLPDERIEDGHGRDGASGMVSMVRPRLRSGKSSYSTRASTRSCTASTSSSVTLMTR